MIRVIIVDDEKVIREGIGTFVRGMNEFKLLALCENGEVACAAIEKMQPDLVISDVLMPKCDGIELIKRCRENKCKCEFIMISGYSEFEYAKAAIQYGVLNYINKPISPELLKEALGASKKIIEDKKQIKKELQNYFYEKIMEKQIASNANRYVGHIHLIHRVILINVSIDMEQKLSFCENILRDYLLEEYILFMKDGLLILILVGEDAREKRVLEISDKIIMYGNRSELLVYIGIGEVVYDMQGIPESNIHARVALRHGQIYNRIECTPVCMYELLSYKYSDSKNIYIRDYLNLEMLIMAKAEKKIISYVNNIAETYKEKFPPYVFYDLLLKCCEDYLEKCKELIREDKKCNDYISQINTAFDFLEAVDFFKQLTIDYCQYFNNNVRLNIGDSFEEVLEYIKLKYVEDISIEQICKVFYMNESYFSSLFKNKMNCNYNEYVTLLRISKGKELLETGKFKVNEVAERVGYNSARYFSKVFKSKTGLLPQEYRNNFINKQL